VPKLRLCRSRAARANTHQRTVPFVWCSCGICCMSPCPAVHREFPAVWYRYEAPDVALHLTLSSTQNDAGEGAYVDGLVTTVASKRVCASLPRHVVSLSCALDVERPPSRAFWTKFPPRAIVTLGRKEFGCLAWRLTPCPINLSRYL
jgi:hypothetical protein